MVGIVITLMVDTITIVYCWTLDMELLGSAGSPSIPVSVRLLSNAIITHKPYHAVRRGQGVEEREN